MSNALNLLSEEAFCEKMDSQNALLSIIALGGEGLTVSSWRDVKRICKLGVAEKLFSVGDQLTCAAKEGTLLWDVVDVKPRELILMTHHAMPNTLNYSPKEALYYAEEELPAGVYNFVYDGTNKAYFTLSNALQAGGVICVSWPNGNNLSLLNLNVYSDRSLKTQIESSIRVTEGEEGTELLPVNEMNRVRYAHSDYATSKIREILNSSAPVGEFEYYPNRYSISDSANAEKDEGFMCGLDEEFVSVVSETEIECASGTVKDKFFIPSVSQLNGEAGSEAPFALFASYGAPTNDALPERARYLADGGIANIILRNNDPTAEKVARLNGSLSGGTNGHITFVTPNIVGRYCACCKISG